MGEEGPVCRFVGYETAAADRQDERRVEEDAADTYLSLTLS